MLAAGGLTSLRNLLMAATTMSRSSSFSCTLLYDGISIKNLSPRHKTGTIIIQIPPTMPPRQHSTSHIVSFNLQTRFGAIRLLKRISGAPGLVTQRIYCEVAPGLDHGATTFPGHASVVEPRLNSRPVTMCYTLQPVVQPVE